MTQVFYTFTREGCTHSIHAVLLAYLHGTDSSSRDILYVSDQRLLSDRIHPCPSIFMHSCELLLE